MKVFNKLFLFVSVIAIVFSAISCEDDFSEQDFLNLQAKLARQRDSIDFQQQLEAISLQAKLARENDSAYLELQALINQQIDTDRITYQQELLADMGLLLSYTVSLHENGVPVEGISVTVGNTAAKAKSQSVTTDANGTAVFDDVVVGANTVNLVGTGYISTSIGVFFDQNDIEHSNNYIIPIRRTESSVFPVFSDGSTGTENTALITGKVTIETDLTNDSPEVAEGIIIAADLSSSIDYVGPNEGSVTFFTFQGVNSFGSATVKADGSYSLYVPVDKDGSYINLLIPSFLKNQTLAYTTIDGEYIGPTIDTISTGFGPDYYSYPGYSSIPGVSGAKAVFPAPTANEGKGFKLKFTPVPSRLNTGWFNDLPLDEVDNTDGWENNYNDTLIADYWMKLNDRGSAYSSSPDIAVSGGGGSGAKIYPALKGVINTFTITNQGEGYLPDASGTFYIYYKGVNVDGSDTINRYVNSFSFVTTGDGKVPASVDLPTTGYGFARDYMFETENLNSTYGYRIIGWEVVVDGPNVPTTEATAIASADCYVNSVRIYDGGTEYISAPTLTFSGGGGTTQADLEIVDFENFYTIEPDNSGVTSAYTSVPNVQTIKYFGSDGIEDNDGGNSSYIRYLINATSPYRIYTSWNISDINNLLKVNSSGNIVWKDPDYKGLTYLQSSLEPLAIINDVSTSKTAWAAVTVSDEGKVSGLHYYRSPYTYYYLPPQCRGEGYTDRFDVTIEPSIAGLPGSGAGIELNSIYFSNNTYSWNGRWYLETGGSGYLQNVNLVKKDNPYNYYASSYSVDDTSFWLIPGDEVVNNIKFGSGRRTVVVAGEENGIFSFD